MTATGITNRTQHHKTSKHLCNSNGTHFNVTYSAFTPKQHCEPTQQTQHAEQFCKFSKTISVSIAGPPSSSLSPALKSFSWTASVPQNLVHHQLSGIHVLLANHELKHNVEEEAHQPTVVVRHEHSRVQPFMLKTPGSSFITRMISSKGKPQSGTNPCSHHKLTS